MSDSKKVAIVNTNTSNLNSVKLACKKVNLSFQVINNCEKILDFGGIILPGVGAFDKVSKDLHRRGFDSKLKQFVASEKPLLGICLGFQLLFDYSEEFDGYKGLGIINGKIEKIPDNLFYFNKTTVKVPFIGWSRIKKSINQVSTWVKNPLSEIRDNSPMFFVHSYYADAKTKFTSSTTSYGGMEICSTISKKNIFATQFHPEKSGENGLSIFNCLKLEIENKN